MIPDNQHIQGAFFKAIGYLDESKNIAVSVSGGSDSDIIVDFVNQCGVKDNIHYIFFDTGLEYEATKDHLDYLEKRYDIHIDRIKAYRSIPYCCKTYGLPFISKFISMYIERLQKHGFKFEDKSLEELRKEYSNCDSALRWWCNRNEGGIWNISYKKFLKEFLIENPPDFKISANCCKYAKKKTAYKYYKAADTDVVILGLRKAEGGVRSVSLKSCYSQGEPDNYRPIWWFTEEDKQEYNRFYQIKNSKCYTQYGFKRTGCACCPFGLDVFDELEVTRRNEPKLYKAIMNTFGKSYEYTAKYYRFRSEREQEIARQVRKTPSLESYGGAC